MRIRNNQRLVALGAAGLVLFTGSTVTSLAAWTDTEWVNGGVSTLPAVTASTFAVEQDVTTDDSQWTTNLASPGGTVEFGAEQLKLTPGATVFGWVRLRTVEQSLSGTLTLVHGASTGSPAFLAALRYGAWLMPDSSTCSASDYSGPASDQLVPDGSVIGTDSTTQFTLAAGTPTTAGAEQTVCFRISFPALSDPTDTSLQGQVGDPVWQFDATSAP